MNTSLNRPIIRIHLSRYICLPNLLFGTNMKTYAREKQSNFVLFYKNLPI